jgi:hypothetical protein
MTDNIRLVSLLFLQIISITCGGFQSNHVRATVAAARRRGLSSYVLLRTPTGLRPADPLEGNLLLTNALANRIRYCDHGMTLMMMMMMMMRQCFRIHCTFALLCCSSSGTISNLWQTSGSDERDGTGAHEWKNLIIFIANTDVSCASISGTRGWQLCDGNVGLHRNDARIVKTIDSSDTYCLFGWIRWNIR